jgi:hypothetical protein
MSFLTRLFRGKKKAIEPMHGIATGQTQAEQDVTRHRMEAEMAAERQHRSERESQHSGKRPLANP